MNLLVFSNSFFFILGVEIVLLLGFVVFSVVILLIIIIDLLGDVDLMPHPLSLRVLSSTPTVIAEPVVLLLLLLTHVELVADALVIHRLKQNLRKPIVVTADLE